MTSEFKQRLSLGGSLACFLYLLFVQPYASGYNYTRTALWKRMQNGYNLDNGEWMFGYAVPFLVIGLLWITRDRFKNTEVTKQALGIPVLLFGFFFYFAGYRANSHYIGYASLQMIICGIAIWHLGIRYFLKGFWLWILFGMMWPWVFLIPKISFPLQKLMTTLTSLILGAIGEDFWKQGTSIISAPTDTLEAGERFSLKVAAACSGLRSFFALAMVSLLYGYIALRKNLSRMILLLSSAILSVLGNVIRMLLLYWGTLTFGKEFAIGTGEHDPSTYHLGAGFVVFIVALGGMVGLSALLENSGRKRRVVVTKKV